MITASIVTLELSPAYPGFRYRASEIAAFLHAKPFHKIIYALTDLRGNGCFAPKREDDFLAWIRLHKIREIQFY